MDQLGTIVAVLGTSDLHAYISKAKIEKTPDIRKVIAKYTLRGRASRQDWESLARMHLEPQHAAISVDTATFEQSGAIGTATPTSSTSPSSVHAHGSNSSLMPSAEGLDLLSKLLIYDHSQRLTARQAMQHRFFDPVRQLVEAEVQGYNNKDKRQTPPSVSEKAVVGE